MNRLYMGPVVAWAPVIGSATSFLVSGAFLWALFRLARRDFPLSRVAPVRALALVLALFFGVEALSGLLSWNGAATAKEIVRNLVFLAFLPICSRLSLSPRAGIRRSMEAAAAAAVLAMLPLSLLQVWGYHIRAEGGAGNAVPFALAALVTYSILVLGCLRAAGRRRILFALAALAAAVCIALSGTRILWPGIAAVPLLAAFLYRGHFERPRIGKAAGAAILAGLALLVLVAYGTVERRLELAVEDVEAAISLHDYSGSFGQRLAIWKVGLDLFAEAPLFGQGPGNAQPLLAARTQALLGMPLAYSHYHNGLLTYAVRDGIPGVLAVLAMLLAPLVLASRRLRDETGAYGLAFTACLVASYALSGSVGILFGHDILDALYVASLVAGAHFMFGSDPDPHLRP